MWVVVVVVVVDVVVMMDCGGGEYNTECIHYAVSGSEHLRRIQANQG